MGLASLSRPICCVSRGAAHRRADMPARRGSACPAQPAPGLWSSRCFVAPRFVREAAHACCLTHQTHQTHARCDVCACMRHNVGSSACIPGTDVELQFVSWRTRGRLLQVRLARTSAHHAPRPGRHWQDKRPRRAGAGLTAVCRSGELESGHRGRASLREGASAQRKTRSFLRGCGFRCGGRGGT